MYQSMKVLTSFTELQLINIIATIIKRQANLVTEAIYNNAELTLGESTLDARA